MTRAILLLCAAASLTGCAYLGYDDTGKAGNPSATPYAGEPGSVFDASAGPPRAVQPEPALSATDAAPMSSVGATATGGPLPPVSQVPGAAPRPQ